MEKRYEGFLRHHIEELEEQLDAIYTIKTPEDLNYDDEKINIRDEVNFYVYIYTIYTVIEQTEKKEGDVFNQYTSYLKATEEFLEILYREKRKIEEENAANIQNIKILLKTLDSKLKGLEQLNTPS